MPMREAVVWCGILTGLFLMFWMVHVLMVTDRQTEMICILLLGGGGLSLLSRQAGRFGSKLAMYVGFSAATVCFGYALLTGLNILATG